MTLETISDENEKILDKKQFICRPVLKVDACPEIIKNNKTVCYLDLPFWCIDWAATEDDELWLAKDLWSCIIELQADDLIEV